MRLVVGFFLFAALCGCGESTRTRTEWTAEENAKFMSALAEGLNVAGITARVVTRNYNQCYHHLYEILHKWTPNGDEALKAAVESLGTNDWNAVAACVGRNKNARQCKERWNNFLCPEIVRGGWTAAEDLLLLKKVHEHGNCWVKIAPFFPRRTVNSVLKRYLSKKPQKTWPNFSLEDAADEEPQDEAGTTRARYHFDYSVLVDEAGTTGK
jgi:hypothetical protein